MVERTEPQVDDFNDVIPETKSCGGNANPPQSSTRLRLGDDSVSQDSTATDSKTCRKCHSAVATLLLKNERVCRECYVRNVQHKFKNALVRYCRIQKDFPNLVAISGGSNSMAMLHNLWSCLAGNKSQKKMFFKVHVVFIDESSIYGLQTDQTEVLRRRALVTEACERYQFDWTVIPLERIFFGLGPLNQSVAEAGDLDSDKYKEWHPELPRGKIFGQLTPEQNDQAQVKIKGIMACVDPSFQGDLFFFFKRVLLCEFSMCFNIKRVLMATTGQGVATKLLSALSKGRGASIAGEVSYCDEQYFGRRVTFCKPMRDWLQKEVAVYNYLHAVEIINQKSLVQLKASKFAPPNFGSTDLIIEGFFKTLQAGYNVNTVPTVMRLTSKLAT